MWRIKSLIGLLIVACVLLATTSPARAQDIEPRSFSNAPVGVNFLIPAYAYTDGGVSFDTSLPLTNPNLTTSNLILAYVRTLDLWGKSGKFNVIAPYGWLSGSAENDGQTIRRYITGFSDPAFPGLDQSLRRPGALGEGIQGVPAGPDRRREPARDRAARPVR